MQMNTTLSPTTQPPNLSRIFKSLGKFLILIFGYFLLVAEDLTSSSCDVGLICLTSKQIFVGGDPLRQISYDKLNKYNKV